MKKFKKIIMLTLYIIIGLIGAVLLLGFLGDRAFRSKVITPLPISDHYKRSNQQFFNSISRSINNIEPYIESSPGSFWNNPNETVPTEILSVKKITKKELENLSDDETHIIKIGHSSILLKLKGEYWLIDPVFSERASPLNFAGPKRYTDLPIDIKDLPSISKVLISHSHYDHLDKPSLAILKDKTDEFLVPLGVEGDLIRWGIESDKVKSYDWWQESSDKDVSVVFTPTRHFSGRGFTDRNRTLWGSWVIKTEDQSFYFSGDSGYFDGFREIGQKYGPFDVTFIETGAYNLSWADIHMFPRESVQAHIDLKGDIMIPIHNGTFNLALHSWDDPLTRVTAAAKERGVRISTPELGAVFTVGQEPATERWWE